MRELAWLLAEKGDDLLYTGGDIPLRIAFQKAQKILGYEIPLEQQTAITRRKNGAHYTPKSLAYPVVEKALQPILAHNPSPNHVLDLKICDPAMGSGIFLLCALDYLALHLVSLWRKTGAITHHTQDPFLDASRILATRCLYGVDKVSSSVSLAKMCLQLFTYEKDLPPLNFDDHLKQGDALVGVTKKQIQAFHWNSETEETKIESVDLKLVGDILISSFFLGKTVKERDILRKQTLLDIHGLDLPQLESLRNVKLQQIKPDIMPFHWEIEFPEVFSRENGGFDSFVGNPPFSGKNGISAAGGTNYLPWLQTLHPHSHGNADLSAHFFRRASSLVGKNSAMGLVATNTISQGDTRTTGLQQLVNAGFTIFGAMTNLPWPGSAGVTVSIVHLLRGELNRLVSEYSLDDKPVVAINSRLEAGSERPQARELAVNAAFSFQGSVVLGMGFTLTLADKERLCHTDPNNAACIFPYIGGEEVNTSPSQSFDRFVISFGTMSLEDAEKWPDLIDVVRTKVKPERDKNNREVRKKYWWRFGEVAPALYEAIRPLSRCLVNLSQATKHLTFCFYRTDVIFANSLNVFPLGDYTQYAVLQGRVHEPWARLLSSSLEDRLRYNPSDCFETFPFPKPDPRTVIPELESIGEKLYETRAKFMVDTNQGLTKTYNAIKDPNNNEPRIVELRELHEQMDRAVLDAYGWGDIVVPPYCPTNEEDMTAVKRFENLVIDRLFLLNAERANTEKKGNH